MIVFCYYSKVHKKIKDVLLEMFGQNEYHNNWLLALEVVEC
jgi:hypothetical protein